MASETPEETSQKSDLILMAAPGSGLVIFSEQDEILSQTLL